MTSPGILRLSHAEIRVPDLQLATAYYAEVVGLVITRTEANRTFLKGWDEHQHHSLILTEEPTYGLNSLAFNALMSEAKALEAHALANVNDLSELVDQLQSLISVVETHARKADSNQQAEAS